MDHEKQSESLIPVHSPPVGTITPFIHREWDVLRLLRLRYHDSRDLWDARELAYLRFYRWLRESGHLES